jgi:hypothetical protein
MAKIRDVIAGLNVLLEVCGGEEQLGGADHDIIYGAYSRDDAKFTPEQVKRLEDAGWHLDEDGGWARFV